MMEYRWNMGLSSNQRWHDREMRWTCQEGVQTVDCEWQLVFDAKQAPGKYLGLWKESTIPR